MEAFNCQILVRLLLVAALVISPVFADEEKHTSQLSFMETLQALEDAEYKELTERIKNMPRDEYQSLLNERIRSAFDGKSGSLRMMIMVDVSTEMNQPEPGFFSGLFSSSPDKKSFGVDRVKRLLGSLKTGSGNSLKYKQDFSGLGNKYFQQLSAMLDQQSAYLLASQNEIADLRVADSSSSLNTFLTIHTPTGRIIPRQTQKVYDSEFINEGLYSDLMKKFETSEYLLVQVSFFEPSDYENTKQSNDQARLAIEQFLDSWPEYKFDVMYKARHYVLMRTNKAHVLAMKEDERVVAISQGSLL